MIDSNINKYIDNNDVLEIYSKSRDNFEFEDFILGIIVSEKDNYLLVETIDDSGLLDSYTLLLKIDISKISSNTNYTNVFTHYVNSNKKNNIYDPFELKKKWAVYVIKTWMILSKLSWVTEKLYHFVQVLMKNFIREI